MLKGFRDKKLELLTMNWYKKAINISQEERDRINDELINELNIEYNKEWTPVNSSFINEVSYNENSKILKVKIKTGGFIKQYTFPNIPQDIYDKFMEAPSKGNFFNTIIKRKYDHLKTASKDITDIINIFLD